MVPVRVIRWQEVAPLRDVNGALQADLARLDRLRDVWEDNLARMSAEERAESRRRSLRRHAIETGIIERLYDVDWGTTKALVAEGLTAEAAARGEGLSPETLRVITDQYQALEWLSEFARGEHEFTLHFIRSLHQALTRHQPTCEAHNHLGQVVREPLPHGAWKRHPNHVDRPDGTRLEYVPPEQVQPQMERLLALYAQTEAAHPLVRASWLHHRFVQIHPFADGNGRVARALTLLVLLRARYAPLVVSRFHRTAYLEALDAANEGDLHPLAELFIGLEQAALRAELERVAPPAAATGAVQTAAAHVTRLRSLRYADSDTLAKEVAALANDVHHRMAEYVRGTGERLESSFREVDTHARVTVYEARPPDERALWWRRQLIAAANQVDFFANLTAGSWWVRLQLCALGQTLRYITAVQKVGHGETGVLAVTAYAELVPPSQSGEEADELSQPQPLLDLTPTHAVTLIHRERAEERWPDVEHLVDTTLSAAIDRFARLLG